MLKNNNKSLDKFPGYNTLDCLFEDGIYVFYHATRNKDQLPVIIKSTIPRYYTSKTVEKLEHEFQITRQLSSKSTLIPLDIVHTPNLAALILENGNFQRLDRYLSQPIEISLFLQVAISIVDCLRMIHQAGVIHKDIKPSKIFIHRDNGSAKITGFEIASFLPKERQLPTNLSLVEGSLPYMAPEQTGRINRFIDNRSDLYALGITFYELLTGTLPFLANDPMEWAHCHIARIPKPPKDINPIIPKPLSKIILKLLEKNSDKRYQSSYGLKFDLEQCLFLLKSEGIIHEFPLGRQDFFESFQTPQKLFGRTQELETLLRSFERVVKSGYSEIALVSGRAGIGKTALINELHGPILRERGFFISGKFDQYRRNIPYSTLISTFRSLVKEISLSDEKELQTWKEDFLKALGQSAQAIIDLIPELGTLLGPQPPLMELPLEGAETRFQICFHKFIGVLCKKEHPLVLFLDDLQWSDSASLRMIEYLVNTAPIPYLFLLGAYRDNEVDSVHPLFQTISNLKQANSRISELWIGPLSPEDLADLISEVSNGAQEQANDFADLVFQKTGGNPLFAIQFLTTVYKEGLGTFDPSCGFWHWDLPAIRSKGYADNIIDLMTEKIKKFSDATLEILTTASCVGISVDLETLVILCALPPYWVEKYTLEPVQEGLLLNYGKVYQFLHDRVRQAAYQTIPEQKLPILHLRIGRLLLSNAIPHHLVEEQIFDIVNHLNQGMALIEAEKEREQLASLNLIAAKKAQASAAVNSAIEYYKKGLSLLKPDMWSSQHDLAFDCKLGIAQCEHVLGNREDAIQYTHDLISKAKSIDQQAKVYLLLVEIYTSYGNPNQAIKIGLEGMNLFGIFIPYNPTDQTLAEQYNRIQLGLKGRKIEDLSQLPKIKDHKMELALTLLESFYVPAANCSEKLAYLIYMYMVNISMTYGNSHASAMGYVDLGMVLGPLYGKYQEGYRFGKVALELVNRELNHPYKARVYFIFGDQILYRIHHLREELEYLHTGLQEAIAHSDFTYASYCSLHIIKFHYYVGSPLDETLQEAEKQLQYLKKIGYDACIQIAIGFQRAVKTLRGLTFGFLTFSDENFDESKYDSLMDSYSYPVTTAWYYLRKLQTHYIFKDYEGALAAIHKSQEGMWSAPQAIESTELLFYSALTLAALYEKATLMQKSEYLSILLKNLNQYSMWAGNCPENFAGKRDLIAAEIARIRGEEFAAAKLYERGIESAARNGYIQIEAIGNELAFDFYRKRPLKTISDTYLHKAYESYRRWGAIGKVRQMEQLYPQLLERLPLDPSMTYALRVEQLDILSVVKASQIISREIVFDQVVGALLQVAIEHGGAERGYLILVENGVLTQQATAKTLGKKVYVNMQQPKPITYSDLPVSIIEHVYETGEIFILSSASSEKFTQDRYISSVKPSSALCIPIVRQTKPVGVLYLENKLIRGVFTREHLAGLELIASQAAISIENARFYSELEQQKNKLQAILDNTTAVIYVKDVNFKYILVNRSWEAITGHKRDEAIGKDDYDLFSKEQVEIWRGNDTNVFKVNAPIEMEEVFKKPDGLHTYLSIKFPLSDQTGKVYAMCGISTDITERKRIEDERLRLLDNVQESLKIRDEFISIAAHELRTPLTPLKLQIEMLKQALEKSGNIERLNSTQVVRIINKEINHLCKLVEDLLDISQIRAGKLFLHPTPVDLENLIRDTLIRFKPEFVRAQCTLETSLESGIDGNWDGPRIEQVLINLITNAIKFGEGKPIRVSSHLEGNYAKFSVQDYGIGIEKKAQERIFDRFERAVSIWHFGGLGLGLYVSKQIVLAHGGKISVQSEPGLGSTFTVAIPLSLPQVIDRAA